MSFPLPFLSKLLFSIIAFLIVFLLILYVWQVNVLAGKTYLRDSLARRAEELNTALSELSIARSQTEFLKNDIKNITELSSFEKVGNISYIQLLNGVVVSRKNEAVAP